MILSELKKQIDFLCETGHGDNPVLVTLSESSVGSRAATGITGIHSGFDWERGQIRKLSLMKKIEIMLLSQEEKIMILEQEYVIYCSVLNVKPI